MNEGRRMNCRLCRWRKNALRCGTCQHLEERIEKENYIPTVAFYPRKDNYEEKNSRPKGVWGYLGRTGSIDSLDILQCSECGSVVLTRLDFNQESYCSKCGADMRGEEGQ